MSQVRRVEVSRLRHACGHRSPLKTRINLLRIQQLLHLLDDFLGDPLLLRVYVEDGRRVLSAFVITLLVRRRWVVEREEEFAKILVSAFAIVKKHVEYFDVARVAGANLLVGRIGGGVWICAHEADGISEQRVREHLLELADVKLLGAPVAASSKSGKLFIVCAGLLVAHGAALSKLSPFVFDHFLSAEFLVVGDLIDRDFFLGCSLSEAAVEAAHFCALPNDWFKLI